VSAYRGTVFLDEIGVMTQESQVKLLRFLEKGEVAPVGSAKTKTVNVRVIAATNRDLAEAVKGHSFREDLYYRLKVVSIHLPPLRERKSDIPLLTESLLIELAPKVDTKATRFSGDAMNALMEYNWPGNVRELKNVIERSLIFADDEQIELEHLPEELFKQITTTGSHSDVVPLDQIEKNYILDLLERNGGNKLTTAKQLNIATTTLYRKLRQYGVE
jgi:transcriptional regulator with PAS, ATPase and Fis domain